MVEPAEAYLESVCKKKYMLTCPSIYIREPWCIKCRRALTFTMQTATANHHTFGASSMLPVVWPVGCGLASGEVAIGWLNCLAKAAPGLLVGGWPGALGVLDADWAGCGAWG
jgi:hypothetical protein